MSILSLGYDQFPPISLSFFSSDNTSFTLMLLLLSANRDQPLYPLDVKNAFLYKDLHEKDHLTILPGSTTQGESGKFCALKKVLNGLDQSRHSWFDKFSKTILTLGYKSSVNHTLFVRRKNGTTAIVVYFDDIIDS